MTTSEERLERIRQTVGARQIDDITAERLDGILSGRRLPTSLEYALIAEACNVTVGWLLNGIDGEALMLEKMARRFHPHPISVEEMRDRFERGRETYRKFVWRGYDAFMEALGKYAETAKDFESSLAGLDMIEALQRHEVAEPAYRIAIDYWSDNYDRASKEAWEVPDGGTNLIAAAHYVKMAVFEYAWPGNQDEILRMVPPDAVDE